MSFKHNGLVTLFYVLFSFASFAQTGKSAISVDLSWKLPVENQSEDSPLIPSLFFDGAFYSDSMPGVPIMLHRIPATIPHYGYAFEISDKKIVPCSASESKILADAGFDSPEFVFVTDSEKTVGRSYVRHHVVPVRKVNGSYEKLQSYTLEYDQQFEPMLKQGTVHNYPESSVLASGKWYRICVDKDGVFKLGRQDLVDLGINPTEIDKSTLQIFGNGGGMLPEANSQFRYTDLQENAIWISGNNSGSFGADDYILFYGQSPNRWRYNENNDIFEHTVHYYSKETCYFLTFGQEQGRRIQTISTPGETPTHTINNFYDYQYHQRDLINIIGSGKIWFGELFDVTLSRTFEFSFPNILQEPMTISAYAAARSSATSSFTLESFSQTQNFSIAGVNTSNATGIYARFEIGRMNLIPNSNNVNVRLTYNKTNSGARGWLNYITVNAKRGLIKAGDQMFFRNPSVVGPSNIVRFQMGGVAANDKVWNVSDPFNVTLHPLQQAGANFEFISAHSTLQEYVLFSDQQVPKPMLKGEVLNQNLHAFGVHDLFIVVPDLLRAEAERLAQFRRDFDGLTVKLISPQQIYNEFSSGVPDISAIRNFMKMFYDRAEFTGDYPRYLLLFGNGTYDNKNLLGYGGNLIPTFQTMQSLNPQNSYISDDFFGLLDDNEGFDVFGTIDIGIGRLPVRTVDEARFVVDKLLRYDQRIDGLAPGTDDPRYAGVISNYSDWRNVISLIADDEDANIHFRQTEFIANYLSDNHPVFNLDKIYLDAYEQTTLAGGSRYPDVNKAINNRVNQGALLVNYIGHGGPLGLAQERILTFDDILSWGNFYNLPVFMTATCEFSSFDQPDANDLSAGVRVFLKPDGGAVALFTTTRLAYSLSNSTLNNAFIQNAFIPMENGEMPRLGDLIRISKVLSGSASTLKNFVLLGDPSMQMAYPQYKAVTTHVPDTIRALEKVTIKGEIHSNTGTLSAGYNGIIYPIIYDKGAVYFTLGNDPGSQVAGFNLQRKVIFSGTASVVDGQFEFSFIVPRDISYNTGTGKISYYFDDGKLIDGNGYFDDFVISGTAEKYDIDTQGPVISLHLNNREFSSGDKTGPNPILLAFLEDESGINTTGQIGHDILAFLNNDTSNPFILNNYYQTELNSYNSGRIIYPFFNLEKGEYTLTLRAWDVHNNVSTESIDFIVTSAPGIQLTSLMNFPNPFSDRTEFSIQHNKPATELNVLIEIFALNGKMVKSIEENVYASGFNVPPIQWDGVDEGGSLLKNGIYIFRAYVSTADGDQVQKTEKLMILR